MGTPLWWTIAIVVVLGSMLMSGKSDAAQIIVDKGSQRLFVIDDHDYIIFESKVIVGRDSRRTPSFTDTITHIVTNPYWNIPASLLRRDVLPSIRKYPGYMDRKGLEVLSSEGQDVTAEFKSSGFVMQPGWRMRQRPGPDNALGRTKFMLEDRMKFGPAIFLHDTNHPELFAEEERRFSSGCVRVEKWSQLSELLGVSYAPGNRERWNKIEPITITIVGD